MRFRISVCFALAALIATPTARQQPPPPAEVFLAPFNAGATPAVAPGSAINISQNPGYDNQPSFLPDGSAILFSSQRDGKQTDIYRYTIASKALAQLTHTPEPEYSPLVTPDKRTFSVVRVEADGAQRLWRFDLDGTNPRLVLENVKPVGYHVWIDATHLALFVLGAQGQPNTLQVADTATGKAEEIEKGIGRSLFLHPGPGLVTFLSKPAGQHWVIKEVDPRTKDVAELTESADENKSEDFAWHPNGALLMSSGAKILARRPGNPNWREMADLASPDVSRVTRLAVSPDGRWIAFVGEK